MPALRAVTRTDGENSSDEQHALTLWWQTMVDDFSKAAAAAVFALFVAMWPHGGAAAHAAASGTSPPQPTAVTAMGLPGAAWRAIKDADASLARQAARFNGALGGAGTEQPASEDERLAARQLVEEVWSVIDGNFLDARGVGFNREKWATLREDAVDQLGQGGMKRAYGVVRSMIASGVEDPYTRFFEPDDFTRRLASKYDVTGIGLNIGSERDFQERVGGDGPRVEGSLRVVGLVTGSTADVAGIGQGDEIVEVDGSSVLNRSPFEVSSLIQESPVAVPKGSDPPPAAISFIRSSDGKKISVEVPRKRIDDEPVLETSLKRENGVRVGYVRLLEFDSAAERELAAALEKLSAAGADRIVLDLRDNPGGLVLAGVEIAKLFLDQGETVVETVSRAHMNGGEVAASSSSSSSGAEEAAATEAPYATLKRVESASSESVRKYTAEAPAQYGRARSPLTLLVNGRTASAGEILAGALQDNCRATVVGEATFGKGLIQSVYELSDGSGLVTTVGKYRLPSGRDLDQNGIQPNFRKQPSADDALASIRACEVRMGRPSS